MTAAERITKLEERIAQLEARLALVEARPQAPVTVPMPGPFTTPYEPPVIWSYHVETYPPANVCSSAKPGEIGMVYDG